MIDFEIPSWLRKSEFRKEKERKISEFRKGLVIGIGLSIVVAIVVVSFIPNTITYTSQEKKATEVNFELLVEGKVTAYNSVPEQTDDTPFITASGLRVRRGIVANNCLEFGTKVEIRGEIYEVQDRKNSRYGCEWFDIWMEDVDKAIEWGVQSVTITIIKN